MIDLETIDNLFIDDSSVRFSGAEWFENAKKTNVAILGCGGIGSWTALNIARTGCRIILIDDDKYEDSNIAGQFVSKKNIGFSKATSLTLQLYEYTNNADISSFATRADALSQRYFIRSNIIICCFDNMESRKEIFNLWKTYGNKDSLFIDGRLSAEELQIFCIKNDDEYYQKEYEEKYLFNDEDAESEVCSYKQTTFMASMIGSMICNIVINFISLQANNDTARIIPFYTEYNGKLMLMKNE